MQSKADAALDAALRAVEPQPDAALVMHPGGSSLYTEAIMPGSILTIGYANRSVEELIALLKREEVKYLIDVRSNPTSRVNPEFSQQPLTSAVEGAGIRYVFMGDTLGGRPADPSCYENGHVIYKLVQQKDFFCKGIERLMRACAQELRVSLLCSESRPEQCHRSKLIGVSLTERGAKVIHLGPAGEHLTQAEVIARLQTAQVEMFADLQSRKAYRPKPSSLSRQGQREK